MRFQVDNLNRDVNNVQKEIGLKKRNNEDATELLEKKRETETQRDTLEKTMSELQETLRTKLVGVGNLVHETVPVSMDEVRVCARACVGVHAHRIGRGQLRLRGVRTSR